VKRGVAYFGVRQSSEQPATTTATMTSKGQITIPAPVRAALGVDAGDRVEFVEVAPGRYELIAATRPVTALKGMFGKPRAAVSIEDKNAAIAGRGGMTLLAR
jgi:antitoxin PrlF